MKALLILLVLLAALLFGAGFLFARYSMRIRRQSLQDARAWQEAHYDLSWYDGLEKEDYTVTGADGYVLHVQHLLNPAPTGKYVIISHGYTDNRFGAMKYAKNYLDLGYDVIACDLRGHGQNAPTFCTYSIRERSDLCALIADTRARFPDLVWLGLHGESLGAATTVAVLEYSPRVDFAVADCGFAEIMSVMAGGLRQMKVPALILRVASVCAKLRYGYAFDEMRPIDSLTGNTVPLLFIHGADDAFITPDHSWRMRHATAGYAELWQVPGAGHAASVLTAPDAYRQHVAQFVKFVEAQTRRD